MAYIDTSIKGFEYIGVKLTDKQYEDLLKLNMLILSNEHRKKIPVFNTVIVLKILGLLPPEMINDKTGYDGDNNTDKDFKEYLQRKFGKVIE